MINDYNILKERENEKAQTASVFQSTFPNLIYEHTRENTVNLYILRS